MALICLIIASVTLDDLDDFNLDLADRTNAACGFIVFLAIMVMLLEGIIIALRFLNFDIVNKSILIFHIAVCTTCIANCFLLPPRFSACLFSQDIVISVVFAVLFFCLAIATAVYAGDFNDLIGSRLNIRSDLGALSVSFLFKCVCVCACVYVCVCVCM